MASGAQQGCCRGTARTLNEAAGSYRTVGDRDLYTAGALATSAGTVYAVQTNLYARKDDAGTRQVCKTIRQGGTNYDGSAKTLGSSYQVYSELDNLDPTGADWTIANVNGDQYGIKVVA